MKRVVVCGTKFGQIYLSALEEGPFELTGILARGGARSAAYARAYGVPLLTDPDQVPDLADLACVVVRAGVVGGEGSELAEALLTRGVHVLQEHPLHPDELARCLRAARAASAVHHVNTLYVHLEPVRRFIEAARRLRGLQQPLYVDAACSVHVAYALFDILGRALGGLRPWAFGAPAQGAPGAPFSCLAGTIAGVPLTLRVQNQIAPNDPDAHLHLLHRITLGTEGGNLTLVNTHGPLVWSPRMYVGRDADDRFATGEDHLRLPSATLLGPEQAPTFQEIVGSLWPSGVRRALTGLRERRGGRRPAAAGPVPPDAQPPLAGRHRGDRPPRTARPDRTATAVRCGDLMSWFHRHRPGPQPQPGLRLFCFPHAGGSASFYRAWHRSLPPAVEVRAVQYPGRADRRADPLIDDAHRLAGLVADAMAPLLDGRSRCSGTAWEP